MKPINKAKRAIEKAGFKMIDNCDTAENEIRVSMEEGDDAGSYYDQGYYGAWGINQKLHDIAESVGGYWEWVNPAVISMYL